MVEAKLRTFAQLQEFLNATQDIRFALRAHQHDLRSLHQSDAGTLGSRQFRQFVFLFTCQLNRQGNSQFLSPMQTEVEHWSQEFQLRLFKNDTLHQGKH